MLEDLLEDMLEFSFYHCYFIFHILTNTKLKQDLSNGILQLLQLLDYFIFIFIFLKKNLHWNSQVLDVPLCLVKHVGASLRGGHKKKWYISLAMIWSKHIEGGLASQDLLDHIDARKCALLVRRVVYEALKEISLKKKY